MRLNDLTSFALALIVLGVAGALPATPAAATVLAGDKAVSQPPLMAPVQASRSRDFRRCMRAKYGPRYFAGVQRAYRFHMAQACGG